MAEEPLGPHEHFIMDDLEFEGGQLVKINGMRPQYWDGDMLIKWVKILAVRYAVTHRALEKAEEELGEHG